MASDLNLLIVDTDPERASFLEKAMGDSGKEQVHIYNATDAEGALNICATVEIQAVLIYIPANDATQAEQTAAKILQRFRLPLITYSEDLPQNEEKLLRLGVQEFLILDKVASSWVYRAIYRCIGRFQRQESLFQANIPTMEGSASDKKVTSSKVFIGLGSLGETAELTQSLNAWGYEVSTFPTPDDLTETILEGEPDFLILEKSFRDKDGIDLAAEYRLLKTMDHVPILLAGDQLTDEDVARAFEKGIDDIMAKPVRASELRIRMQKLMQLRRRERDLMVLSAKLQQEKSILTKYFSEDFVDSLLHDQISTDIGGKLQTATVLFFDLRNSTGLAESITPERFSYLLNSIFHDLMDLVYSGKGTVNKLIGDGMMVTFGTTKPGENDPLSSVMLALRIRDYFDSMNEFNLFDLPSKLNFGVGISTGSVFVGNIGSFRKMEFTVLGDAVNVASRLESLTKKVKCDILMDENTGLAVKDAVQVQGYRTQIRGKVAMQRIFKLIGEKNT